MANPQAPPSFEEAEKLMKQQSASPPSFEEAGKLIAKSAPSKQEAGSAPPVGFSVPPPPIDPTKSPSLAAGATPAIQQDTTPVVTDNTPSIHMPAPATTATPSDPGAVFLGHIEQNVNRVYNQAKGLPIIGETVGDIGTATGNLGKAYQEMNSPDPLTAMQSAAVGAVPGAIESVETPLAAAYGVLGQPGHIKLPNIPQMYEQNPIAQQYAQAAPGSYQTGKLLGNLVGTGKMLGVAGKLIGAGVQAGSPLFKSLIKLSPEALASAERILQKITEISQPAQTGNILQRTASNMVRGAGIGGGVGAVQEAGQNVIAGQGPKVTPRGVLSGAAAGALGGAIEEPLNVTGRAAGKLGGGVGKLGGALLKKTEKGKSVAQPQVTQQAPKMPIVTQEPQTTPEVQQAPTATAQPSPVELKGEVEKQEVKSTPPQRKLTTLKQVGLDKSKPRYKDLTPEFDSDLDKALYVIGNPKTKSAAHDKFMDYIRNNTDWDDAMISTKAAQVRKMVKEHSVNAEDGTFKVPRITQAQEPITTPTPKPDHPQEEGEGVMTPEEFDKNLTDQEKKFYEKTGRIPVISQPEPLEHADRASVPANKVFEKDRKTKFDVGNPKARAGVHNGIMYAAMPDPYDPKAVRLGSIVTSKHGEAKRQEAYDRLRKGTSISGTIGTLQAGEELTPVQDASLAAGKEYDEAKKTPARQSRGIKTAVDLKAQKAADAIKNDDKAALQEIAKPKKSLKVKGKGRSQSGIVTIPRIISLATEKGITLENAWTKIMEIPADHMVKTLKGMIDYSDTMDAIKKGAERNKSDFFERLQQRQVQMFLDSHGTNVTEGKVGAEVNEAVRYLSRDEILDPEITPDLTQDQREAAVLLKDDRAIQREMINEEIKKHPYDLKYVEALKEYGGMSPRARTGTEEGMDMLSTMLYNASLKYDPRFHATQLTHIPQVIAAEVGPINTAEALNLSTDPEVKKFLEGSRHATARQAQAQFGEAASDYEQPKPLFHSMEKVNETALLGGMIQEAKELRGEQEGVNAAKTTAIKITNHEPLSDQEAQILTRGLDALRKATGQTPGGYNRIFTSRTAFLRFMASMSGYHGLVTQQMVREIRNFRSSDPLIRKAALRKMITLYAATTFMGGNATVPTEARRILWMTMPGIMYEYEFLTNHMNAAALTGRVMNDHMRFAAVNWGFSMTASETQHLTRAMEQQWKKTQNESLLNRAVLMGGLLLWEAPVPGMSPIRRNVSNFSSAQRGYKDVVAYDNQFSQFPIGKGHRDYNYLDVMLDNLPGDNIEEYNFKYKKYVKEISKETGWPVPKNLETDYPSKVYTTTPEQHKRQLTQLQKS